MKTPEKESEHPDTDAYKKLVYHGPGYHGEPETCGWYMAEQMEKKYIRSQELLEAAHLKEIDDIQRITDLLEENAKLKKQTAGSQNNVHIPRP